MSMTLDEFKQKANDTRVTCRICGKKFFALSGHLLEEHQLSVGSYRNKYGKPGEEEIPVTSELVAAMMKSKTRVKFKQQTSFEQIWAIMTDWDTKSLEALGANMPTKNPELIPRKDDAFNFQKRPTSVVALSVTEGMNLFISGPTECGKTSLVEQVHACMKRPCLRCNMTGDTSIKNFLGQMQLNASGTYFQEGILLKAMKLGATLLIDEIDFMPPHIGAVMHPVLEKGRTVFVPDLNEHIKAESGFTVIATANTGGKGDRTGIYTGTEVLNTAFLDRFQLRLEAEYLPQDVEMGVLMARFPRQKVEFLLQLVSFATEVRTAFKQGSLEVTLGTRKLEDFVRVTEKLTPIYGAAAACEAYRLVLTDWLTPEEKQLMDELKNRVGCPWQ